MEPLWFLYGTDQGMASLQEIYTTPENAVAGFRQLESTSLYHQRIVMAQRVTDLERELTVIRNARQVTP